MTISAEEWAKLEQEMIVDRASHLMGANERKQLLQKHTPELYLKAQHRTVRAHQRRLNKRPVLSLEFEESENFYSLPASGRALEDLVLECIDAGIELDDYL